MASSKCNWTLDKPHCECGDALCPTTISLYRTVDDGAVRHAPARARVDTATPARSSDAYPALWHPGKRFALSASDSIRQTIKFERRAREREAAGPVRRRACGVLRRPDSRQKVLCARAAADEKAYMIAVDAAVFVAIKMKAAEFDDGVPSPALAEEKARADAYADVCLEAYVTSKQAADFEEFLYT